MKVLRWVGLVITLVLAASSQVEAQKKTSRDTTAAVTATMGPPNMQAMIDSIGPMFSALMGGMYGGIVDYLVQPETAVKLATFAKNYFDELLKRGFTRAEALTLVQGIGVPGPMGR